MTDRALLAGAAAAGTGLAWIFFASRPPIQVLAGTRPTEAWAPAHYQASVFPVFVWFAGALGLDVLRGRARETRLPRAVLLGLTGALAVARLDGAIPVSGHALFLLAALGYSLASRYAPVAGASGADAQLAGAPGADAQLAGTPGADAQLAGTPVAWLAVGGLAVTAWYKLAVWNDAAWFGASSALGAVLGSACGMWARAALKANA